MSQLHPLQKPSNEEEMLHLRTPDGASKQVLNKMISPWKVKWRPQTLMALSQLQKQLEGKKVKWL